MKRTSLKFWILASQRSSDGSARMLIIHRSLIVCVCLGMNVCMYANCTSFEVGYGSKLMLPLASTLL